ncbi:DUF3084 domain-containing protein [Aetokthonos hydrillicola Thurmond2011]|uniref:DUF3084 domain-containing protein n=1 Tax=Aetokthonos hydrillicola Thurmond2011 TaxID=2712845 RepID=A0AAP5IF99_9CYAN|nr:DUF3084 domain-containing protein [Aetokthonos hydrillicola]MBO3462915.1 DUF3084 domain-containing protein [Aetokthonos hydrillicola CCALA 1050]MBW4584263.1 DUF3084 domain-containing protein [Aetokthonos hydrillicola CCALA 1050]MDR9898528.1 DUF3084 domain-containing protein [Aetokthonos hydrillicola Thurmond2011]
MATGYILIAVILVVGGLIATVGDRIGTRVGKKRLSLFKLRPKNTAVLVTILTGTLIAASTLAILFAADDKLRQGVFKLEDIQRDLRRKREQLDSTTKQLDATQTELRNVKKQQAQAQEDLRVTNKSLQEVNAKQQLTQAQLNRTITQQAQTQQQLQGTQNQLTQVVSRYQQAIAELKSVDEEKKKLLLEVEQRKAEREKLIKQANETINQAKEAIIRRDRELANRQEAIETRDQKIARLDQLIQRRNLEITQREQVLVVRETRLRELETQQNYLEQEVAKLEKYYQSFRDLRLGKLALIRGQVIAAGVIRAFTVASARQGVLQILQEANKNVSGALTEPGSRSLTNENLLRFTQDQVDQVSKQVSDGREYVVRIFVAGNYVRGEKQIEFFTDAAPNQVVFSGGEVIATTTADPKTMTSYQLRERLEQLISASQFRARNAGILENLQIEGTLIRFMSQLSQYTQPVDIKAIAVEDTYTAGPLKVKLVAIQNGKVIFST